MRGKTARLVVLGALTAFGPLSIDMYLPALPRLTRDFGASASVGQLTLTACLLGLAAGQLLAGPLSDRFGRRPPLLAGVAAYVAASLACALAPSVAVLVVARLVQGLAGAAGIVVARAIVRDLYGGTHLARVFARLMLVNGLAPIAAPVLGSQLLRITSWRGVFVALTGIGVALLAAAATLAETLPPERRREAGFAPVAAALRTLVRDRGFVGYTAALGFAAGAMFVYIAGSPFVLQDLHHVSPQLYAGIFALNAVGIVAAGQVSAGLVHRTGSRPLLTAGLALQTAGAIALVAVVAAGIGVAGIVPALFGVVAAVGFVFPNASALALADHPEIAGSASGLIGVFQFTFGAVAAPLAGAGGARSAWPMALAIAAFALLAAATLRAAR